MIIMNNSLVSKIPIWMKFVGHKKVKKTTTTTTTTTTTKEKQRQKKCISKEPYRKTLGACIVSSDLNLHD